MAQNSTMPAAARFFARDERKFEEGVYTLKMSPYNRSSLLIAEPRNEAESSLKTKQPIGVGACCAGGDSG
jgi:hypothetical protein